MSSGEDVKVELPVLYLKKLIIVDSAVKPKGWLLFFLILEEFLDRAKSCFLR
jgi:hypothetical protein